MRDPANPRRARSLGPRPGPRVPTIDSESRARKSTPPFAHCPAPASHRCTNPACALLDDPSAPASRSRLRARAPQNPPVASTPQPTPLPSRPTQTHSTFLSRRSLQNSLHPHSPFAPHPEPVEWCRSPRGGGVPRPPIRGRGPIECRSRCVEAGNQQRPRVQSAREYPPQPPTGGRGSPAPRKGSGTHRPKQSTQPAPHILLARRGSKGCLVGGDVARGRVVSECQ